MTYIPRPITFFVGVECEVCDLKESYRLNRDILRQIPTSKSKIWIWCLGFSWDFVFGIWVLFGCIGMY